MKSNKKKPNKQHKHKNTTDSSRQFTGTLDVTRSGMGFVIVEGRDQDILIRPSDFNTALHGDTVQVKVTSHPGRSGRVQGEVTEVLQRKQLEFLGHIEISQSFAFFIAEMDKPMPDIYVPLSQLNGASHNDKVIVRITEWEHNKKPQGTVIQIMDSSDVN